MNKTSEYLEVLWNNLLSRRPEQIRAAFDSLDKPSQTTVLNHLRRMVGNAGWQLEQRVSAETALQALGIQSNQDK
jgi:hypothetical protein